MNERATVPPLLLPHLADGLEKRKRFDVAHRAPDLDNHHVHFIRNLADGGFDFIGDVRDDLNSLPQIVAAALFGDDGFINASRRAVVVAQHAGVREPFVMTQVEIGFRPVVSDKDFAVLERAHRPGIHVQVRVEFQERDLQSSRLEERSHGRGGEPFAERADHTSGHKDVFGTHTPP